MIAAGTPGTPHCEMILLGLLPLDVFCIHGILQARALEWVAMPSSRGSSPPTLGHGLRKRSAGKLLVVMGGRGLLGSRGASQGTPGSGLLWECSPNRSHETPCSRSRESPSHTSTTPIPNQVRGGLGPPNCEPMVLLWLLVGSLWVIARLKTNLKPLLGTG